jgi:uncharacterized protein (UPF0335 family)
MRKFSKILESNESDEIIDIKDIFIELTDIGFDIKIEKFQGIFKIKLKSDENFDKMTVIKELLVINDKMNNILNLYFLKSEHIVLDKHSKIDLVYKSKQEIKKEDVNNWEDFNLYIQNVLNINGIEGLYINEDKTKHLFRINVANSTGFSNSKYYGWEIETVTDNIDDFISEYPGYENFLRDVLDRELNWDGLWGRDISPELKSDANNALKFDKEGIEVVEKLIEMANKFPNKIKIHHF